MPGAEMDGPAEEHVPSHIVKIGINGTSNIKTHPKHNNNLSDDDQAVRDIRKLVIDCCRQNISGHGGSAIGMAPLAVALWCHTMRYSPSNPDWYDPGPIRVLERPRWHSALRDAVFDRTRVDDDERSQALRRSKEREVPGIEISTGPLGQGIANAVGMAIASKQQAALFNKDGDEIISSRIYCTTGDACLQEGVALEAMSIAGHMGLDNLVLIYDNNGVTCDGPLDWIDSEDINLKMIATGWHVIDVFDGDSSVDDIVAALSLAKSNKGKPTFINIRTTIGYRTSTAGTAKSHHGIYTAEDAALYQFDADTPTHTVSEQTKHFFQRVSSDGVQKEARWNKQFSGYLQRYPADGKRLQARISGKFEYKDLLANLQVPTKMKATRESNGFVFQTLIHEIENLFAGGADVWGPNKMGDPGDLVFERDHYQGRIARYGIREHAMASISNGLAAYSPNTFIPITATFFMFYLYAAAGVRMGALNKLHVIHVATHDSIQEGQNGPTHQPVELDSLFRAMPSLLYIRPSNAEEVVGAWMVALGADDKSSIISVARDPVQGDGEIPNTDRNKVSLGAYTIVENDRADVTIVSSGSELKFAVDAAEILNQKSIKTRVVSMPCICIFEQQSEEYKDQVLSSSKHVISVEPYVSTIWARYCTASIAMDSYGYSASAANNYARFGLDVESIVEKIERHVRDSKVLKRNRVVQWQLLK